MIISVELQVPRRSASPRQVLVRTAGLSSGAVEVALHALPDVLHDVVCAAERGTRRGLHPVDAAAPASTPMDDTHLRLVIDLVRDPAGVTTLNLRRLDRPVDYGPLNVDDLPHVIEALIEPGGGARGGED